MFLFPLCVCVCVVNEKTSYFHQATTSNEFLRITQTGDILRSIRLTVTASCPMDLRHFPMDSQLCNIEIESCKFQNVFNQTYIWKYFKIYLYEFFPSLTHTLYNWNSCFDDLVGYTMSDIRFLDTSIFYFYHI
jgi:hypothetical protein